MKTFNLSRWAIEHKSFVVYLVLVIALAGIRSSITCRGSPAQRLRVMWSNTMLSEFGITWKYLSVDDPWGSGCRTCSTR